MSSFSRCWRCDAVKFQRNMFTGYQRNTFYWTTNQCTLDGVNTRKSLKYKGFLAILNTEHVRMVSYIYIYKYFYACYGVTMLLSRTLDTP